MYTDNIIEKMALSKYSQDITEWESKQPPEVVRERRLIEKVQDFDDMFAMKELLRLYRGTISNAITSANLTSVMDLNTAQQYADKDFRTLVKNFDLTIKIKPNSYITGQLPQMLKRARYENRSTVSRKNVDLEGKSEKVSTATLFLEKMYGRKPTTQEIFSHFKNVGEDKISAKDIQRIGDLTRKEKSADQKIGNIQGAEHLTLGEVMDISAPSPADILKEQQKKAAIDNILMTRFTHTERKLIREYYGWTSNKSRNFNSINAAAVNNGMSSYNAKKILNQFLQYLKEAGY
jgi:hypothetical protein